MAASLGVGVPAADGRAVPDLVPQPVHQVKPPSPEVTRAERTERLEAQVAHLQQRIDLLERGRAIEVTTNWLRNVEVPEQLCIATVIATRNRVTRLGHAVDSVLSQAYGNLELLIVDDGSTDGTARYLESLEDPRIRTFRTTGTGCTAARNVALEAAQGDVVTYLDDDNRFDHLWLKAVAWAFEERPDVQVLYGARVVDDVERHFQRGAGGLPWLQFLPWDRQAIQEFNRIDMNVLAHGRNLAGARFDEDLDYFGDWDLVLKLTEACDPLELPVVAAYYTTDEPLRLSNGDSDHHEQQLQLVRARYGARSTDGRSGS
jgi:glycosyltransferase involved in cell wall biosynthesis